MADPDGAGGFLPPRPLSKIAPGRSLGARFDAAGNLVVCNGPLGLLTLSGGGGGGAPRQLLLANRVSAASPLAAGRVVEFANSLDIASDGSIYFSHSTDLAPFRRAGAGGGWGGEGGRRALRRPWSQGWPAPSGPGLAHASPETRRSGHTTNAFVEQAGRCSHASRGIKR